MIELEELERLNRVATNGNWEFRATKHSGGIRFVVAPNAQKSWDGLEFIAADCSHSFNGELIASMRNALPALIECAKVLAVIESELKRRADNGDSCSDGYLQAYASEALAKLKGDT